MSANLMTYEEDASIDSDLALFMKAMWHQQGPPWELA